MSNRKRVVYSVLGFIFIFLGLSYLFNSFYGITGFVVIEDVNKPTSSSLGLLFVMGGLFLLSKTRERKRGQAAMEFLMTYGWAILAAIIAIGVLAYFGVFSPGKFTPSTVVVSAPFYTEAWNVQAIDGTVNLEFKNNGGETFTISSVAVTNAQSGGASVTCIADTTVGLVDAGALVTATLDCGLLTDGDTFKGDITITYTKSGSNLPLTSTGTITDTITVSSGGGQCVGQTNSTPCNDGLYCNGADECQSEVCVNIGPSVSCDDSISCTTDSCNEGTDSCDNIDNCLVGFSCDMISPGMCIPDATCGNNIQEGSEACDGTDDAACPGLCQGDCTCPTPTQCNDGNDNDGDNEIDFPADFGCTDANDNNETNDGATECSDGIDNDGDTLIDQDDTGACTVYTDNDETNCGDSVCEGGETSVSCPADCVDPLSQGLAAYWNFDGDTQDSSGNNNHGTIIGDVVCTVPGMANQACSLGGNFGSDRIEIPFSQSLNISGDFSLSAWVKRADGGNEHTIYSDGPSGFSIQYFSNLIVFRDYGCLSGHLFGSVTHTDLGWHHIAVTASSTGLSIFMDGVLDTSNTQTLLCSTASIKKIGTDGNNGRALNGTIDELRIYNRTLSASEVLDLFNNP